MRGTGVAAVSVHLTGGAETTQSSTDLLSFLLVMLAEDGWDRAARV